jgi:hypothetical protein
MVDEQLTIPSTLLAGRGVEADQPDRDRLPPAAAKLDLGVAVVQSDTGAIERELGGDLVYLGSRAVGQKRPS